MHSASPRTYTSSRPGKNSAGIIQIFRLTDFRQSARAGWHKLRGELARKSRASRVQYTWGYRYARIYEIIMNSRTVGATRFAREQRRERCARCTPSATLAGRYVLLTYSRGCGSYWIIVAASSEFDFRNNSAFVPLFLVTRASVLSEFGRFK